MRLRWYEPVEMGSTSVTSGYCGPCNTWWMGGHTCPPGSPEDERLKALFRDAVREAVREALREYAETFERLRDQ